MRRFLSDERRRRINARPQWAVVIAFAMAIAFGALLLMLPASNVSGEWLNPLDAFFTATSATCVTGLVVVDTGTQFTRFGQSVVLSLIQLGGLGIMTFGTFLLMLMGRRLSVRSESIVMTSFGTDEVRGLRSLLRRTVGFAILFEGIGTALLAWRHLGVGSSPLESLFQGAFHAISAFCNAGFSLTPDNASLVPWRTDALYVGTVMALLVAGGLGFLVLHNLSIVKFWRRNRRTRGRLSVHSRIVLMTTAGLLLFGWIGFVLLEWHASLADLPVRHKLLCGLFHAVTPRTAGFNVVSMPLLGEPARLLTMALMFVGGSPGSTAGGVKTTTLFVLILTMAAMIRGRHATLYRGRAITDAVVREAIVIFLLATLFVGAVFGALLLTEPPAPGTDRSLALLFEAVSAFGTVGLSLDLTPTLSGASRVVIIIAMFVGRLGPLTMALTVGTTEVGERLHYPEEEVVVG